MGLVRVRQYSLFPDGTLGRRRHAPGSLLARPRQPAFPGRLRIGYQITADRLQGQLELAYRMDRRQVLTTILWDGRIDDVSRRVLRDALFRAAEEACPVRLHAFAVAARELFRHRVQSLAARHQSRVHRGFYANAARHGLSEDFIPKALPLHDDLLAATRDLRKAACLRPGPTILEGADADGPLQETLSALRGLFAELGVYLERVSRLVTLPATRNAIHELVLEIRREVDELATRHAAGNVYVEEPTVAEPYGKSVSFEAEGSLGLTTSGGSGNT